MARTQSTRARSKLEADGPGRGLGGSFALAYFLAFFMYASLMYVVGPDGILAMTRLYGIFQRGGLVPFSDADVSVGSTAPELGNQLAAQDPIDWGIVAIAVAIFFAIWVLKALQFHGFARFTGLTTTFGENAKAFWYGNGINRWIPFNGGRVAMATALEGQGASRRQAAMAAHLTGVFEVLAIVVFALVSWFFIGVATWIGVLAGPLLVFGACYILWRPAGSRVRRLGDDTGALRALGQQPGPFTWLGAISLATFMLEVLAAYLICQAFTSDNVLLNLEFPLILVGILGAHIARLIPLTPGGLGQYEWGFVLAVYVGGGGFGAATTTAIVTHAALYITATLLMFIVSSRGRVATDIRQVLAVLRGGDRAAQPAS